MELCADSELRETSAEQVRTPALLVGATSTLWKVTHRFHAFKLLSLLDLLQLAHIFKRFLLKVLPHGFHLAVCLERWRTHIMMITDRRRGRNALAAAARMRLLSKVQIQISLNNSSASLLSTMSNHITLLQHRHLAGKTKGGGQRKHESGGEWSRTGQCQREP